MMFLDNTRTVKPEVKKLIEESGQSSGYSVSLEESNLRNLQEPVGRDVTFDLGAAERQRKENAPGFIEGFTKALLPSFQRDNFLYNSANLLFRTDPLSGIGAAEEDGTVFNPFDNDIVGTWREQFADRYVNVRNKNGMYMVDQRIAEEQKRNELISSQGSGGMVAGLVAGLFDVDATMLIPAIKGGKLLSIAGKTAVNAAIGTASQEALLQQTQLTRTGTESAVNIGTSAVIGGLLGPAVASGIGPKTYNYIKGKFDKPLGKRPAIISTDPELKATDTDDDFDNAAANIGASTAFHGGGSVGAAVNPDFAPSNPIHSEIYGKSANKVARATSVISPGLRTSTSPAKTVREFSNKLVEKGYYTEGNFIGQGQPAVETAARVYRESKFYKLINEVQEYYKKYRKEGGNLTFIEFRDKAGRANRRNDQDPEGSAHISAASSSFRNAVAEPVKNDFISLNLMDKNVKTVTAPSWFYRVWNKTKLIANKIEFKEIVKKWFREEIAARIIPENEKYIKEKTEELFSLGGTLSEKERQEFYDDVSRGILYDAQKKRLFDTYLKKFTRIEDAKAILNDILERSKKHGDLKRYIDSADQDILDYFEDITEKTWLKLTGQFDDGAPSYSVPDVLGPLKGRTFTIPDELIEDFLVDDIFEVADRFLRPASAEIEMTRVFGEPTGKKAFDAVKEEYYELSKRPEWANKQDELAKFRERDLRDLKAMRDIIRGTYGADWYGSGIDRAVRVAKNFNVLRAMGGVTLSSLPDAARPIMTQGFSRVMKYGIKPLFSNLGAYKEAVKEARLAGVAEIVTNGRIASMAELNDPYAKGTALERWMNNTVNLFFKVNGMAHWNDFTKTFSAVVIQNRIIKNCIYASERGATPKGPLYDTGYRFMGLPKEERAYMGFLGISEDDAVAIGNYFKKHGELKDNIHLANSEQWGDDPQADAARRVFYSAINKDVNSTIVTPGVGDIPLFAKTPIGSAILQFRTFFIGAHQRAMLRGLQEEKGALLSGMLAATTIGMFVYWLKTIESGREVSNNAGRWIAEGLDRSGMLPLLFEASNTLEKMNIAPGVYDILQSISPGDKTGRASRYMTRGVIDSLAGPTTGLLNDLATMLRIPMKLATDRDVTEGDINAGTRLIPGGNLPIARTLIQRGPAEYLREQVRE